MNLVDFLEKETGLPALCENDVNCAALAEYWQGAGKGAHMLLCMTLGTGIGGALVHEGRLYRGASYAAGEVGQAYLGSSETWENWASVSALLTAAEIKRGLTLGSLTGQEFFAFVEKGEEMETHLLRGMGGPLDGGHRVPGVDRKSGPYRYWRRNLGPKEAPHALSQGGL